MERSLYRRYRPLTFEQVVGQDHVSRTLTNAIRTGSVAHAYVFAGPRGTGKTSVAKILAMSLNCTGPDADGKPITEPTVKPCGVCESCRAIRESTALDVIEMDAASNRGIDDIRELRDKVAFAPVSGRRKVYIIDEAHMLTKEAFNALLKTLEEPPPHIVFVMATTEVHKLLPTILSRCQRFDFRKPRVQEIARLLAHIAAEEQIEIEEPALLEIARHSEGGFRDAIGTLEKLATFFAGETVTSREVLDVLGVIETDLLFEVLDIVIERDPAGALMFVQRLAERGVSYPQFITDLLRHLRQVFLLQHLEEVSEDAVALRALSQNLEIDEELLDRLIAQANQFAPRELLRFVDLLGHAQSEIRAGLDQRLQLELALVRVARPGLDHSDEALEERLRRLEAGSVPLPARRAPQPLPTPDATPALEAGPVAETGDGVPAADAAALPADQAEPPQAAPADTVDDIPEAAPPGAPARQAQTAWSTILEGVRRQDDALYAFLRDARARAASDTRLTVTLGSDLAYDTVARPANRELLAGVTAATVGAAPEIELVRDDDRGPAGETGAGDAGVAGQPPADLGMSTAKTIRHIIDSFDAVELTDDE